MINILDATGVAILAIIVANMGALITRVLRNRRFAESKISAMRALQEEEEREKLSRGERPHYHRYHRYHRDHRDDRDSYREEDPEKTFRVSSHQYQTPRDNRDDRGNREKDIVEDLDTDLETDLYEFVGGGAS